MLHLSNVMRSISILTGIQNSQNKSVFLCRTKLGNPKVHFLTGLKQLHLPEYSTLFDIVVTQGNDDLTFFIICEPYELSKRDLEMYNIFAEEIYIKHAMPFSLGRVVVTRELYNSFSSTDLTSLLQRHENCDWGNCCLDDALNNDKATKSNQRILSSYKLNGTDIWIITEHDRSVTTILYPRDY